MKPVHSTQEAKRAEERFTALEKRGIVIPARDQRGALTVGLPNPGALARFPAERNE